MGRYFLDPNALLDYIRKSSHLTHGKYHYLENNDYVVGPKADGERMLLFWGGRKKKNKRLYLISPTQLRSAKHTFFGHFVSLLNAFEDIYIL
jgi:hypothetical protein